jgi:hypothetical protein
LLDCSDFGNFVITLTYLFVEAHIMDVDDTALDLDENLVSPPTSLYPYRAYIEILLSYGPAAKESQLTGVMWYKDTPGHQDKENNR